MQTLNTLNIKDIDSNKFTELITDINIDKNELFDIYLNIMKNQSNININLCHIIYEYMQNLSDDQIDKIDKSQINNYLFFKYLPSIELINKYYTDNSNKIHGVSNNCNITKEEREKFIKEKLILKFASTK